MSALERRGWESTRSNGERRDKLLAAQRLIDSAIEVLDELGMAVVAAHASLASELIAEELNAAEGRTLE